MSAIQAIAAPTAFTRAAAGYWCLVYPRVCAEVAEQRRRAAAIPDRLLRGTALGVLAAKRSNIDGAAAFAAFVPQAQRTTVIRAQVAFQSIYDYLDTLAERPHPDPVENSRSLHGALRCALDPGGPDGDYYAHQQTGGDGGYLSDAVARCRAALLDLPCYEAVQPAVGRLAERIVDYQSLNVTEERGVRQEFASWADGETPAGSDLRWWETAASAGSSLGVFALIAMAAGPSVQADHARAVEEAYFPWIGALHSLLDSLVDRPQDAASGQCSLVEHYGDAQETALRLTLLARESRRRAEALPDAGAHMAILAAMAALYLAEQQARMSQAGPVRAGVLHAIGALGGPSLAVMRLRRLADGGG